MALAGHTLQSVRLNRAWMRGAPSAARIVRQVTDVLPRGQVTRSPSRSMVEVPQLVARPHAARDAPDGPFERKAVVPSASGQQSRIPVARVDEVLAREQALGGQALMDL